MARKAEATNGSATLKRVSKRKKGYDVRQVDSFLEQAHALYDSDDLQLKRSDIQDASFDIVKGGYSIPQVDATLERLEQAVTDKHTAYAISQLGRVAWKAQEEQSFRELEQHAQRPEGARFALGAPKTPSYDRKQVDALIDRILDKAEYELQHINAETTPADDFTDPDANLTAQSIANVTFTQRKGKRGYDERQVDYYLNACADLLGCLESFNRLNEYGALSGQEAVPPSASFAPLIPETPAQSTPDTQPVSYAPAATTTQASSSAEQAPAQTFDELSRAEQEIFTASQVHDIPQQFAVEEAETQVFNPITDDVEDVAVQEDVQVSMPEPQPVAPVKPATPASHTPTLADIHPITPAPRTIPGSDESHAEQTGRISAVPVENAVSDETTITIADQTTTPVSSPSLAALATMANTTAQAEKSEEKTGSFTPIQGLAVPKLNTISIPDLPMPHRSDDAQPHSDEDAAPAKKAAAPTHAFPASSDMDVDIPDLSFPTFSSEEPLIINDQPNERYNG